MTFAHWVEYALINITAGGTIALDACILVILKFRSFSSRKVAFHWAGAVGLTHIFFPMIGFVGGWILIQKFNVAGYVYGMGAILLSFLICSVVHESTRMVSLIDNLTPLNSENYSHFFSFWVPVMYVSIDALLAGPGKTVFLERYPRELAILSFFLVGIAVAIFTLIAGEISCRIHRQWIKGNLSTPSKLAEILVMGVIGEIVMFSFFFVWSLFKSLYHLTDAEVLDITFFHVVTFGLVQGFLISFIFFKSIRMVQLYKAAELIRHLE